MHTMINKTLRVLRCSLLQVNNIHSLCGMHWNGMEYNNADHKTMLDIQAT